MAPTVKRPICFPKRYGNIHGLGKVSLFFYNYTINLESYTKYNLEVAIYNMDINSISYALGG